MTQFSDLGRRKNGIASKKYLHNIREIPTKEYSILSIENFDRYIDQENSTPDDLKAKWNNLEGFLKILWQHIDTSDVKK